MIAGPSEVLVIADGRQRPGLDRRRPAGPGRARRRRAVDPDHRRRRPGRRGRGRGRTASSTTPAARRRSPARRWRDHGAVILVDDARRGRRRSPTASRPSISSSSVADAEALARRVSAMPARSSSAATRRRRSATTSPAPTTCCRRRARRASRPASACSTSSSAPRSSTAGRSSSRALAPAAIALAEAEGLAGACPFGGDPAEPAMSESPKPPARRPRVAS